MPVPEKIPDRIEVDPLDEALDRMKKLKKASEKRRVLQDEVQKSEEKTAESFNDGDAVKHKEVIEDQESHEITQDVIDAAAKESAKATDDFEVLVGRSSLRQIIDYVAAQTQVPAAAIYGVLSIETHGKFDANLYNKKSGKELGMGQFMPGTWATVRRYSKFKEVMTQFTEQDPTTIGRARSVLADILGIGLLLKKGAKKMELEFDHTTHLKAEQLIALRFYYHMPSYAVAVHKERTDAYAEKAKLFFEAKLHKYQLYAENTEEFYGLLSSEN